MALDSSSEDKPKAKRSSSKSKTVDEKKCDGDANEEAAAACPPYSDTFVNSVIAATKILIRDCDDAARVCTRIPRKMPSGQEETTFVLYLTGGIDEKKLHEDAYGKWRNERVVTEFLGRDDDGGSGQIRRLARGKTHNLETFEWKMRKLDFYHSLLGRNVLDKRIYVLFEGNEEKPRAALISYKWFCRPFDFSSLTMPSVLEDLVLKANLEPRCGPNRAKKRSRSSWNSEVAYNCFSAFYGNYEDEPDDIAFAARERILAKENLKRKSDDPRVYLPSKSPPPAIEKYEKSITNEQKRQAAAKRRQGYVSNAPVGEEYIDIGEENDDVTPAASKLEQRLDFLPNPKFPERDDASSQVLECLRKNVEELEHISSQFRLSSAELFGLHALAQKQRIELIRIRQRKVHTTFIVRDAKWLKKLKTNTDKDEREDERNRRNKFVPVDAKQNFGGKKYNLLVRPSKTTLFKK